MKNMNIQKILIANRGEIAMRIIKTCREMGIQTVAIYSDVDQNSMFVRYADESFFVGSAPAKESYLHQEKIIEISKRAKVDAIHPGYGFLSENPSFVRDVEKNHIIFIGPSEESIQKLGNKIVARKIAKSAGVPIVPGTMEPIDSFDRAQPIISSIGYPVLLKAAGGGGGKGMRIINSDSELASGLRTCQNEARLAFGDDRIFIEKYISNPRHIEVQILADQHGRIVHLGERDCSIQRRHQKIVEESPSIAINQKLRDNITEAAVEVAKKGNYTNAGTVEFILDPDNNFYFLEMNTRLQVEHPVTEMRSGIDIVRQQILISEDKKLSLNQNDISLYGHAIEARICAEDPLNNFFPSTGTLRFIHSPRGMGLREDTGVEQGDQITPYYDPMISKLIAWGATRDECLGRMSLALKMYQIYGVRNNLPLCSWIIDHPKFREGSYHTHFLQEYFSPENFNIPSKELLKAGAAVVGHIVASGSEDRIVSRPKIFSQWRISKSEYYR